MNILKNKYESKLISFLYFLLVNLFFIIVIQLFRGIFAYLLSFYINFNTKNNWKLNGFVSMIFILTILLLIIYMLIKEKLKYIGFDILTSNKTVKIINIIGISLIIFMNVFYLFFIGPQIGSKQLYSYILSTLYMGISVPIVEEILFRGIIWRIGEKYFSKYKKNTAITFNIIANSILFSLWHVFYIDVFIKNLNGFELKSIIIFKLISGLVWGIGLSYLRNKTDNAIPGLILHMLNNILH